MREKLIDIITDYADFLPWETIDDMADSIIESGFTQQKWIPVTERLPEDTLPRFSEVKQIKVLTALKSDKGVRTVRSQMRYKDCYYKEDRWVWKYSGSEITHWMPLPEPPKDL